MSTVANTSRITVINLASDSAGPFDIDFTVFAEDALRVFVDGVETVDFSEAVDLTSGYDAAPTITLDTAATSGSQIIVFGEHPFERGADYTNSTENLVAAFNAEFTRIAVTLVEAMSQINRGVRFLGEDKVAPLAVDSSGRAGRTLLFSEDGNSLQIGPVASDVASAQTYAEDAEASRQAAEDAAAAAATFDPVNFVPTSGIGSTVQAYSSVLAALTATTSYMRGLLTSLTSVAEFRTALSVYSQSEVTSQIASAVGGGDVRAPLYESSPVAFPSAGSSTSAAHGLGRMPHRVEAVAICTSATAGFSVGDEVNLSTSTDDPHTSTIWRSSTSVGYAVVGGIQYSSKTGSSRQTFSSANWNVKLKAW